MPYNELYSGYSAPANIKRKNGARYLWKKNGLIYTQTSVPEGNTWVVERDVNLKINKEVDTGNTWVDGKPIYKKLLTGTGFSVSGSYSIIAHGVDNLEQLISSSGYVGTSGGPQYSTYANYVDGVGNFRFFWTGGGAYDYAFYIEYTRA